MIIVEGCDNTGKTTLIDQLIQPFPTLQRMRSIGNQPGLAKWLSEALLENQNVTTKIYDRFFFSELVYGPVLRGRTRFTGVEKDLILGMLAAIKPLVILCSPPPSTVSKTIYKRPQMGGVIDRWVTLNEKYHTVIKPLLIERKIPYLEYDFTEEDAFEKVKAHIAIQIRRVIE